MKRLFVILTICSSALFYSSCSKEGLGTGTASSSTDKTSGFAAAPGGGMGGGSSNPGNGGGNPGVITAGEWDDLDHWDFWNKLLQRDTIKNFPDTWGFYTGNRITVTLRDANGQLVHDAKMILTGSSDSYAVTDNFGKAELFPGLFQPNYSATSSHLTAQYNGQTFDLGMINSSDHTILRSLPVVKTKSNVLDIMFVVDATGSMGDELNYLKTELKDVVNRAGSQLPGTQIRMGSVFYRDNGDDYVVRPFGFTTDLNQLSAFINNQEAGGGGDFPEAVDQGLDEAVNHQQWSSNAINRLIFLVLDAPSHKTPEVLSRLKNALATAQQKGIRIIPVSASGIDRETEFLLRFFSVSTNSTYVFITNDSGIGNPHLQPTVGDYQVEFLNNLMVRLITRYGQNKD